MAKKDVNQLIKTNRPTAGTANITASSFRATEFPDTALKVAFIDNDGKKIGGLTVKQAIKINEANPTKKFYFENGDGYEEELTIEQVKRLQPSNYLPSIASEDSQNPIGPQVCGPPLVRFFGGGGGFGAAANVIISPESSSVIGFDIINPGFGYLSELNVQLVDRCGAGSGASIKVNMDYDDMDTTGEGEGTVFPEASSSTTVTLTQIGEIGSQTETFSIGLLPNLLITYEGLNLSNNPINVQGNNIFLKDSDADDVNATFSIVSSSTGVNARFSEDGKRIEYDNVGDITIRLEWNDDPNFASSAVKNIIISGINDCVTPRKEFEKKLNKALKRSKKIKNITIISPGDGYLAAPDGSLGGNERTWKDPEEGYVKTKCEGYYVVQPYKPILVEAGSFYFPPDGNSRFIPQDEIITLPLVPVKAPPTVSITDIISRPLAALPISIVKEVVSIDPTGNGIADSVGDIITYRITITNTTSQILTNVIVKDPLTGLDKKIDRMNGGESFSFITTYTITQRDLNSPTGIIENTATAISDQQDEPSVATFSVPLGPGGPGIGTTSGAPGGPGGIGGPGAPGGIGGPGIPPVPVYSVVLSIEEIVVLDPGFGYRPGDELIVSPNNGTRTELIINEFGNITGVKILEGGRGYTDLPELRTNSSTGFNATFSTILKPTRVDPNRVPVEIPLVSVIDCVGIIPPKTEFDIILR